MGCSIFWEAQEYSAVCQARCRKEIEALAQTAGWEYEVLSGEFTEPVIDLNRPAPEARAVRRTLRLDGVMLFPFGRNDEDNKPRLSFVFDNTPTADVKSRNRLITIAPAGYWIEWNQRIRDQYPILSQDFGQTVYGIHHDGSMRVRRTEMPGFISFLNTVRATCLPLLEIHSNDRQARKMISDASGALKTTRGGVRKASEQMSLSDIAEGLGVLFAAHRYDEWRLGLSTEEEIEREQAKAARAVGGDRPIRERRGRGDDAFGLGPRGRGRDSEFLF